MKGRMSKNQNLAIIPGGFEEATFFRYGSHRVFLKNRKGFVKYALQFGYKLYPVYAFGEEQTYWAFSSLMERLVFLNRFKIPAVVFFGLGFMPWTSAELTTVVGAPVQLPKISSPTADDVAKWHEKYQASLLKVFRKHRGAFAKEGERAKLEVL